jgi:DNA-binding beta-propeller fold protein YncE
MLLLGLSVCENSFSQTSHLHRQGDGGPAVKAWICDPTALAVTRGALFVAEGCEPNAVRRIELKSGTISTLTALPPLESITNFVVDHDGNLIGAEGTSNRIFRINTMKGTLDVIAGTGDIGFSGDGGPATQAKFNQPYGVALDQAGNLFIADSGNSRIRRVDARTGIITTVAGSGKKEGITGDGGPALEAGLEWPMSVAVDHAGNLYIGQNTNDPAMTRIRRVDSRTELISTYATTVAAPLRMLFDEQENLIFVDGHCIKRIDSATGMVHTIAGSVEGFSGDGGPAIEARFENPCALAFDESGNLYIADFVSHRIRRISSKDNVIETFAGNGEPHHVHVML